MARHKTNDVSFIWTNSEVRPVYLVRYPYSNQLLYQCTQQRHNMIPILFLAVAIPAQSSRAVP
jgi:hypothetical protein